MRAPVSRWHALCHGWRGRPTGGLNVGRRDAKMQEIIAHARAVGAPIEIIDHTQIYERYGG